MKIPGLMADPVTILLAALSRERLGAPIGAWVDSPDVHGWLLRNGRYFAWLTDELPAGVRMGKSGNCFEEAQRNALKCSRLIYCEGYAAANGEERPVPHGWCIDTKRGLGVVDTVWRGRQSPDRIYYGVPLKKEMIRRFQEKPGKELSLLLWAAAGWPIQSGMIPEGEWRAPLGGEFLAVNLNSQTQCLS